MIQKVRSRSFITVAPLEPGNPRSSATHRLPLERPNSRSSGGCTLPEVFRRQVPARAANSTPYPPTPRSSFTLYIPLYRPNPLSSVQHNTVHTAFVYSPLELTSQNLGNQTGFLSSTNLLQIFPTQPKTENKD